MFCGHSRLPTILALRNGKMATTGSDFSSLLASLPLRSALLTDQEGIVLLRTAPADSQ